MVDLKHVTVSCDWPIWSNLPLFNRMPHFCSVSCTFLQDYEEKDRWNLGSHCYDANVVVRPKKGTAVMWYNHMISNVTGLLGLHDVRSIHGGCDVLEGSKWIANNWINAPFEWTDEY